MSKTLKLADTCEKCVYRNLFFEMRNELKAIERKLVLCMDCKYWVGGSEWYEDREYKQCQNGGMFTAPNHYCAWGERSEE